MKCGGCEKEATTFQCPLCQAQDNTESGFYCSQECFAKQWLAHRDECHKSGVVREKTVLEKEQLRVEREDAGKEKKGKKRVREGEAEAESPAKNGTPASEEADASVPQATETTHFPPWQPIPVPATCAAQGLAQVTPPLPVGCPKAVVEVDTNSLYEALWPAATAAAHYVQASLQHAATSSSKGKQAKDAPKILIIAGTNQSAHACAWACRSAGLASKLRMVVSTADEEITGDPSAHFTAQYPIVITSSTLLQHAGKKTAGSTSLWLTGDNCLLITLPDVALPEDYQTLSSRAVFFVTASSSTTATETDAAHGKKHGNSKKKSGSTSDGSFTLSTFGKGIKGKDGTTTPFNLWTPFSDAFIGTRFDNEVSTCFARGDLPGALHHLIRLFGSSGRNRCEEVLRNTLMADWGSSNVVVAHHRLAYTLRFLVDRSEKFAGTNASKDTLQDVALRAICRVASFLPPLAEAGATAADAAAKKPKKSRRVQSTQVEDAGDASRIASGLKPRSEATALELDVFKNYFSSLPNLQLQATLCYIFPGTAAGFIDRLANAWGINRVVGGPKVLVPLNRGIRRDACERVQKRYSAKLDSKQADYYVVLMHFIYDAVGKFSLPLEVVAQRTQWSIVSEHDVGPLAGFLQDCFLLSQGKAETVKPKAVAAAGVPATLSSRKSTESTAAAVREREAAYCAFPVKPCSPRLLADSDAKKTSGKSSSSSSSSSQTSVVTLTYTPLPLTGARQRQVEHLRNVAIEEILMAMPRKPTPMYIGDVGNLIGSWFRFNGRYDGALGTNLGEFLLQNPLHFRVVSNVVTRCKAGSSDQVRIRFDDDDEHGDDSDDSDNEARKRKNRDRRLLTGGKDDKGEKVHHSTRAKKKDVIKQFNKERFNKNHKKFDTSAKVPGYVKHGPRKIKGRGRKVNKRNFRRAA